MTDLSASLLALLPTAEQLKSIGAGAALGTGAQLDSATSNRFASVEIPRALLNPLESLPPTLSRDDVRPLRDAATSTRTQTY